MFITLPWGTTGNRRLTTVVSTIRRLWSVVRRHLLPIKKDPAVIKQQDLFYLLLS
jgi:hypothetical protein